jgi:hypothetical protein
MCSDRRKMADPRLEMTTPKPFDGLLGRLTNESRKEMIREALINSDIEGEPDLRDIVAGANRTEATTLLQNSVSGLSYRDAAILAGLVLPQGFLPSLLPPHNHLNRTTTRPRSLSFSLFSFFNLSFSMPLSLYHIFLSTLFSKKFQLNLLGFLLPTRSFLMPIRRSFLPPSKETKRKRVLSTLFLFLMSV